MGKDHLGKSWAFGPPPRPFMREKKFRASLMAAMTVFFLVALGAVAIADATGPTIASDKDDYAPGEIVTLTGTGWQGGEAVHIRVNDDQGETWRYDNDVTADDQGSFTDSFQLPDWFVATYAVTATGPTSGTATTTFTDGNVSSWSGQVKDASTNLPISGATVSCTSGCNASLSTTTDASGNYYFDGASGHGPKLTFAGNGPVNLTLTASKSGYTSATQTKTGVNNQDSFSDVNFALTPSCTPDPITGPANVGVTYGDNATFTVAGVSSRQWQVSTDGVNFSNLVGETGLSLTLTKPTVAMSGNKYRVVGLDSCGGAVTAGPATLTVNPKSVTVTASSPTVTYGDAAPTITPSYSGFVSPDTAPTTAPTCSTTYTQGSHVNGGPYTTSCSGAADPNYSFIYVGGTVTVNKAGLTVTASSPTVTYGDAAPTITPSYSGFVLSEGASVLDTAPTCSTTYTQGSHVNGGPYTTSCTGGLDNDYSFIYVGGTVTVNQAGLTVTADNKSIYLGQPDPPFTFQYSGFVLGETASVLDTAPTCGVAAHSGVGTFPIVCSGGVDNDYSFTYVNGTLSVTYNWTGFFQPVENPSAWNIPSGWNKAKAGSAIPVKFNLGGNQGLNIFTPGWPKASAVACPSSSTPTDWIEETVTAGGSSLTYDTLANQYIYVWKTDKAWANKCFRFDLGLNDGTYHSFYVQFFK